MLAERGSVRAACTLEGVSAETVYRLRRRCARFAAGWDGALVLARQVAEDVLAQRALEGVEEPVFYRGEQVGSRWRLDARLLLAHLARLDVHAAASRHGARRAERFDELLALIGGEAPPPALAPRGDPEAGAGDRGFHAPPPDPELPPERALHAERAVDTLPDHASDAQVDRRTRAAETQWDRWRVQAAGAADRLVGLPYEVKSRGRPRWTVSTVSTGVAATAPPASAQRPRFRPTASR